MLPKLHKLGRGGILNQTVVIQVVYACPDTCRVRTARSVEHTGRTDVMFSVE